MMGRQQALPQRVLLFIQKYGLVREGETLVVGVSGGPDSVCLLHILAGLRETLKIELHIAHLNHLLRGGESDADAEYVSSLALELGIPATIERRKVKDYQREHRLSLEEAARELRYSFFAGVAHSLSLETVAVGHTADDQIETILMHLVRGTGLAGLRGMQPLSAWQLSSGAQVKVVRPLLEVRRKETEAYCSAHGLCPRSDSSNLWPNQLRNQIRCQLLPLLREYNPDIEKALLRTSRAADADLDYIEEEVSQLWGPVAREQPDGIAIEKEAFSRLHLSLKRHLIRSAFQRLLGDLRDIESVHVEALIEALSKSAGKRLSLPRGLTFHSGYGHGLIATGKTISCPFPALEGEHRLKIPGETEFCGWKVRSSILDHLPTGSNQGGLTACLDLDVAGKEIMVIGRRRGDKFQPLGMKLPKKLQDFMVDARIPRSWRDHVPLACSPQHILWVVGWRIDHRARVTSSTKRVLCLEFEPVGARSPRPD